MQTPSVWERKSWQGSLPPIALDPQGIGILEMGVTATAFDVMVDFSATNIALPVNATGHGVLVALYTFAGNLRTYRTSYTISPSGGVEESHIPADLGQGPITQDGNRFIIQASGNIGQGWGIQAIASNWVGAPLGVTNLWIGAIAHGVEVLP